MEELSRKEVQCVSRDSNVALLGENEAYETG